MIKNYPSNGLSKEEVLSKVKLILIFSELSLLKDNNYSLNEKEGKIELDIILDFIFIKYIEGIHSYFGFINLVENQKKIIKKI